MEKPVPVVKLYNFFRSSASFRVRIALNLKKIQYEYISINIMKGDQKEESYVKKNPTKVFLSFLTNFFFLNLKKNQ